MKILILNGNPVADSFSDAISGVYLQGAKNSNHDVKAINIRDLDFDIILRYGYKKDMELESDIIEQQKLLKWCEHLVLITPVWWGSTPALLKGYFDRVLLPGFAYKYRKDSSLWDRLLSGRSARVIYTCDTPWWFEWLIRGDSFWKTIKGATLGFCGFKPVKRTRFNMIRKSTDAERKKWLEDIEILGKKGK